LISFNRKIRAGEFFEGGTINYRKDGVAYVGSVEHLTGARSADGRDRGPISSIQQDITARGAAEREAEEARRQQARAEARLTGGRWTAPPSPCASTARTGPS